MRRALILTLIFLVLLALPFIVLRLVYYDLVPPDRVPMPTFDTSEVAERVPTPEAGSFTEDPDVGEGFILLDYAHDNDFELHEISFLDSRLSARGYELLSFEGGDLENALRRVDAFIVIAPLSPLTMEDVQTVANFIDSGGRLLLVGDPTRFNLEFEEDLFITQYSLETDEIPLNSLANEFDLVFNGDYLYNTVENEGNFRNILLQEGAFAENSLTEDIDKLALYGSHSIGTGTLAVPILLGDENTWSSATDRAGGLVLAALGGQDRVLAIGDIDFLSNPYYTVYDNARFIINIADFLTEPERSYGLNDFPFFFGETIDLVYTGDPDLGFGAFDEIIDLQQVFQLTGRKLSLSDEPSAANDVLYLGLYNQSEEVADLLDQAGVSLVIEPPITDGEEDAGQVEEESSESEESPEDAIDVEEGQLSEGQDEQPADKEEMIRRLETGLGNFQMSGTALIILDGEGERKRVVVLASSAEGLENTVSRLVDLAPSNEDVGLSGCILQSDIAVCPSNVDDEIVAFRLETGGEFEAALEETLEEGAEDEEPEEGDLVEGGIIPGADYQGTIGIGETVEGFLSGEQAHSWGFEEGPAIITIILQVNEEMDAVLELYDPDGGLLDSSDSGFIGEEERLANVDIPTDGEYLIVVREFFGEGGNYQLAVESGNEPQVDVSISSEMGELDSGLPVSGTLSAGESHAWTFTLDEPAEVTILVLGDIDMDPVLILIDPDDQPVESLNDTGVGEAEFIEAIELGEPGVYTIIVSDFEEDGGTYLLVYEMLVL